MRIGNAKVQAARNRSMLQRQHYLHQSRDSRSRFQVSQVGLDRPDHESIVRWAPSRENGIGGLHLDRVPEDRRGAMTLEVLHVRRLDSRGAEGVSDDARL